MKEGRKKMKKKIIMSSLGMLLMLSCVGCGKKESAMDNKVGNKTETSSAETETEKSEVDYTISFNGVEYTFPMSYEEFVALGWEYYDTENADPSQWGNGTAGLPADSSGGDLYYNNGEFRYVNVIFYNNTDEFATYDKCEVVGFAIDYDDDLSDIEGELNIPEGGFAVEGLVLGEATKEQVEDKIGAGYGQMYTLGDSGEDTIDFNRNMILSYDENDILHGITYINIH